MGAAVGHRRDHWPGALGGEEGAEVIGVVGFVGDRVFWRRHGGQKRSGATDVGRLSWRQQNGGDAPLLIRDGVDLGRPSIPRRGPHSANLCRNLRQMF
jgi:hypothetical protein